MAAKLLATKLTHRVDGEAFAAGILHDIGKLILSASGRVEGNKELPSLIHLADFLCRRERIGDGGGELFAHGEHQEMAKAEALPASPTAKKGKTGGASTVGAAGGG